VQSITSWSKAIFNGKAGLFQKKGLSLLKNLDLFRFKTKIWKSSNNGRTGFFLGNKILRITVAKYMNELGLRSKSSKKFKTTTNSTHNHLIVPNVLNRKFSVAEPSKVWVSNVTYIRVKEGFYI
jgi:hypothetical protein